MMRLLSLVILCLFWLGGPESDTHATVALGSPDLMAFPCDTNYNRQAPHFCVTTLPLSYTGLTMDNTCRTFSALSTPTPAIDFMLISVNMTAPSQNSVTSSNTSISFYTDVTCATLFDQVNLNIYEDTAVPLGTELIRIKRQMWVPIVITGNQSLIYYKGIGPTNAVGQIAKLAYYDH